MAGGKWLTYNKKLPGAYINFKSVPIPASIVGSRGVSTMPLPLSWGKEDEIITLLSTDLEDGKSLAKVGVTAFDDESKLLRECLKHCYKLYVYRIDKGGKEASKNEDLLSIKAKYKGELGNTIKITITKNDEESFDVKTYFREKEVDFQQAEKIEDLKNNDYVIFNGNGTLVENAGIILVGGKNGI